MYGWLSQLLVTLLILAPAFGVAQSAAGDDKLADLLEWKTLMAANKYELRETVGAKFELIARYEEWLSQVCMSKLPETLEYDGPGENKKCRDLIDKTLALDPKSPPAICARDGIDSASCRDGFNYVIPWEGEPEEFQASSRSKRTTATHVHDSKLSELQQEYEKEKSFSNERLLLRRYREVIGEMCADVSYALAERAHLIEGAPSRLDDIDNSVRDSEEPETRLIPEDPDPLPAEIVVNSEEQGPKSEMDELMERLESLTAGGRRAGRQKQQVELPQANVLRVRYLSRGCAGVTKRVLETFPGSSLGLCAQFGLYSPQCADAMRADAKKASERATGFSGPADDVPPKGPSFSRF